MSAEVVTFSDLCRASVWILNVLSSLRRSRRRGFLTWFWWSNQANSGSRKSTLRYLRIHIAVRLVAVIVGGDRSLLIAEQDRAWIVLDG